MVSKIFFTDSFPENSTECERKINVIALEN